MGRNVSVLPVVINSCNGLDAFISRLQSIVLEDISQAQGIFCKQNWEKILEKAKNRYLGIFQYDWSEGRRTQLLEESAREISQQVNAGKVRQQSVLTSFSLPSNDNDENWADVPPEKRSQLSWYNPSERIHLEALARRGGCDLIINPAYFHTTYDIEIQKARLQTLRHFLAQVDDEKVRVVIWSTEFPGSLTIIGNYWAAYSVAFAAFPEKRQTMSTRHAQAVEEYCDKFDEEFSHLFEDQQKDIGQSSSRLYAITCITYAIKQLQKIKPGGSPFGLG